MTIFAIALGLALVAPFLGIHTRHMAEEKDKTTLSNLAEELRNRR